MSGAAGRLGVAIGTAVLCGAALLVPLLEGPPAAAPSAADLGELQARMAAGARLHPPAPVVPPRGSEPFCRECHPAAPHRGTRVRDAVTNAHAGWMDCLGCHWASEAGERPAPAWVAGRGGGAFAAILPADRATPEALAALRAQVTERRPCFVRGPDCGSCHRVGGMEEWARTGGQPSQLPPPERLEAVFTLAPGEKWYFPQFQ